MAKVFELDNVLLYRSRLLSLRQAFRSDSSRLGGKVAPLAVDDARLAIAADDQRSKATVEELLGEPARRASAQSADRRRSFNLD